MMTYTYLTYLTISVAITIWVGRSLHSNGRVFLVENFAGREAVADSVNHLLLVGFYLVNFGFVSLALRFGRHPDGIVESIEYLSTKIGIVILVLGFMHFFNMFTLMRFRKSRVFSALGHATTPPAVQPRATALPLE